MDWNIMYKELADMWKQLKAVEEQILKNEVLVRQKMEEQGKEGEDNG